MDPAPAAAPALALTNPKLRDLGAAVAWREAERAAGRRVVLTNGVYDLLHTGHLHALRAARALGDALLVCLNADAGVRALKGPARPVQGERERAFALGCLEAVDCIVIFDTPRLDAEIRALRPDVYVKSGDYTRERLDPGERRALEEGGAEIHFVPFLPGYSTTSLIARIHAAGGV